MQTHQTKGRPIVEIPPILVEELRQLKAEEDALRNEFGRNIGSANMGR